MQPIPQFDVRGQADSSLYIPQPPTIETSIAPSEFHSGFEQTSSYTNAHYSSAESHFSHITSARSASTPLPAGGHSNTLQLTEMIHTRRQSAALSRPSTPKSQSSNIERIISVLNTLRDRIRHFELVLANPSFAALGNEQRRSVTSELEAVRLSYSRILEQQLALGDEGLWSAPPVASTSMLGPSPISSWSPSSSAGRIQANEHLSQGSSLLSNF